MSGGSLNYLYLKDSADLMNAVSDLEAVEAELLSTFGAKDVARDVRRLIEYINSANNRISVLAKQLQPVLHAAEDLVVGTWEVASLALAVQEGIYHGSFAPEHYEGAMSALVLRAEQVRDQTNAAIEGLYKAIGKEVNDMAREILFRGKKNADGKWIEGSLMKVETCGNLYNLIFGPEFRDIRGTMTSMSHAWVIDETVGQFTGCLDRNGRKIFEGDICRFRDPLLGEPSDYEVVWSSEWSRWGVKELGSSGMYINYLDHFFCAHCEVVGTIFDDRT